MAHNAQINVNGVLTTVTEFDNPAQAIDDAVTVLGAPTTPQAALSALGAGVRPRLGINMDFQFNQRGQSAYTTTGYGVDGWTANFGGELTSGSVAFNNPGVTITANGPSASYVDILQHFEDDLLGKTVTFSVLYDDGTFLTITGQVPASAPSSGSVTVVSTNTTKSGIWIRLRYTGRVYAQIRAKGGYSVSPVSAKLEEGPNQTLAYQDSTGAWHRLPQPEDGDYAGRLLKCQQYLVPMENAEMRASRVTTSAVRAWFPTPVPMRTDPVLSSGSFQVKTLASGTVMSGAVWSYQVEGCGVIVTATLAGHGQTDGTIYSNAAVLSAPL